MMAKISILLTKKLKILLSGWIVDADNYIFFYTKDEILVIDYLICFFRVEPDIREEREGVSGVVERRELRDDEEECKLKMKPEMI